MCLSVDIWKPGLDAVFVLDQFTKAFFLWSNASALTITQVRRRDADMVISWYKGQHHDIYKFDGRGGTLAHAFFPGGGIGGDIHFDAEEIWDQRDRNEESGGMSRFALNRPLINMI